jgi:hypothetical protein
MSDAAVNYEVDVVRGDLGDERAEQILRFWSRESALDEAAARRRLSEVVCVLLDGAGELAGVNSVYPADVGLVGGRPFWIYRSLLAPAEPGAADAMVAAAFGALEAEFDPHGDGPIGLCLLIADRAEMQRRPEAEWPEPRTLYAGYLGDGRQVRIAYFEDARIGQGIFVPNATWELEHGYRVEPFADQDAVGHQAVIDLWTREGAVPQEEALRRVHEVVLVATDAAGELVGVSTAYLQRNAQLGIDLWYYRGLVAHAHQRSSIGVHLALIGRDHLKSLFVSGRDTRGAGIVFEVQNEGLKQINNAVWLPSDFTYIGENERGDHVRVHYFPGALAPDPPR